MHRTGTNVGCHYKAVLYTKTSSFHSLAKPRPQRLHATAAAKPLTLACRRRRGSVQYGADQVPMTCIHDSHLHAATLIRRTYMEFGDATGCSISSPLPLGCPEARPRGHARTIVARLDIWHRNRTTKRLNLGRGVGQIKMGCCHTRPFRLEQAFIRLHCCEIKPCGSWRLRRPISAGHRCSPGVTSASARAQASAARSLYSAHAGRAARNARCPAHRRGTGTCTTGCPSLPRVPSQHFLPLVSGLPLCYIVCTYHSTL